MSVLLRSGRDWPRPRKDLAVALGVADAELAEQLTLAMKADGMEVPVHARDLDTLVSALQHEPVEAVVVDQPAKRQGDVRARLEGLITAANGAPTVLLCEAVKRGFVRSALKAGAQGVLLVAEVRSGLPTAVRAVHAGHVVISATVAYGAMESGALSHREKQVLGMVVRGLTNRQISEKLFLAESTVKGHLSSAFDKLGANSRSEAAALILDSRGPDRAGFPGILASPDGGQPIPIDRSARVDGPLRNRRAS